MLLPIFGVRFTVNLIWGSSVKALVPSSAVVKVKIGFEFLPGLQRIIRPQIDFSYLTLFQSRSTKMVSIHRPFPSILMRIPLNIRASVNSSDVN
jgi:hypothetical protein